MLRASKKLDDVTPEERADSKQFETDKLKQKTKVSSLDDLIKELHS